MMPLLIYINLFYLVISEILKTFTYKTFALYVLNEYILFIYFFNKINIYKNLKF